MFRDIPGKARGGEGQLKTEPSPAGFRIQALSCNHSPDSKINPLTEKQKLFPGDTKELKSPLTSRLRIAISSSIFPHSFCLFFFFHKAETKNFKLTFSSGASPNIIEIDAWCPSHVCSINKHDPVVRYLNCFHFYL